MSLLVMRLALSVPAYSCISLVRGVSTFTPVAARTPVGSLAILLFGTDPSTPLLPLSNKMRQLSSTSSIVVLGMFDLVAAAVETSSYLPSHVSRPPPDQTVSHHIRCLTCVTASPGQICFSPYPLPHVIHGLAWTKLGTNVSKIL